MPPNAAWSLFSFQSSLKPNSLQRRSPFLNPLGPSLSATSSLCPSSSYVRLSIRGSASRCQVDGTATMHRHPPYKNPLQNPSLHLLPPRRHSLIFFLCSSKRRHSARSLLLLQPAAALDFRRKREPSPLGDCRSPPSRCQGRRRASVLFSSASAKVVVRRQHSSLFFSSSSAPAVRLRAQQPNSRMPLFDREQSASVPLARGLVVDHCYQHVLAPASRPSSAPRATSAVSSVRFCLRPRRERPASSINARVR